MKQEDASIIRTGFCLEERGVWDECGWVRVLVRQSEEFVNGEIGSSIRGEENVGYVVQGHEFRNNHTQERQFVESFNEHHLPCILVNTITGHLYNRAEQASAFKSLLIFKELVASIMTHSTMFESNAQSSAVLSIHYVITQMGRQ